MSKREYWTMATIVMLSFLWPLLLGVFEASVGPQGNSVGTAQLRTATGSFTQANPTDVNVNLNDYAFAPSVTTTASSSSVNINAQLNVADPNNTIGALRLGGGSAGQSTVRWRYITTTDNPFWWVCKNALGIIISSWTADDPPSPTFVTAPMTHFIGTIPDVSVSCQRIMSSDLQALNLSGSSYTLADSWIRAHGYSAINRDFRALQHAAGSLAPSVFLLSNFKVVSGVIVPITTLPTPINAPLP